MYLLFDIGGTKARFALSEDGKELLHTVTHRTPGNWEEVKALLDVVCSDLVGDEKIERIVGGVPGQINTEGILLGMPHLPLWRGQNLGALCEDIFEMPAEVHNDAELAALGEAISGAGTGFGVVGYLGIGTGIGGAKVVNGVVEEEGKGFEPGQHIMEIGEMKSFEDLAAGSGVEDEYHVHPRDIEDSQSWIKIGKHLGIGLFNTRVFWAPDVIVLGGTMYLRSPDIMRETAEETYRALLEKHDLSIPPLKPSKHGDLAGLMGALAKLEK